ncbi:MAG: hypothetical protein ACF8Q5_14025 [Phycisphaerales bacterium JB040]
MRCRTWQPDAFRRGVSLIEVALSTVVLAVVLTGALRVLAGVVDRREHAVRATLGRTLADDLLAQAMSLPFTAPGVLRDLEWGPSESESSGGAWGQFNDCDDFDGWESSPPKEPDGDAMRDFPGWSRSVSVEWVSPDAPDTPVAGPTDVKRITVEVHFAGKAVATSVGYRTRAGQRTVEPR